MFADILEKILSLFGGGNDADSKKKRLLKDIKKNLKKSSKFYNPKKDEVTSQLAQFFYNIYKIVNPYSELLFNVEDSKEFKNIIVESFLNEHQLKDVEHLTVDAINKRFEESKDIKKTISLIHKDIVALVASFSTDLTNRINMTYSLILVFKELACFNYYFLLKKFDSRLPSNDFVYKPSFSDIKTNYVGDDLKDFLEVIAIFEANSNWKDIFAIFTRYRSSLLIDNKGWNRIVKSINDAKRSLALLSIVKIADEDPFYKVETRFHDCSIVEDYINGIKEDAEKTLKSVMHKRKIATVNKYIETIFGDPGSVERNKYYINKTNITFEKKGIEGYLYVDPMNYLRAYYLDYFKTEAKPILELLIIQGQWAVHVTSQEFSEAFHQIQNALPKTIDLDKSLADDGPIGSKIKNMLRKSGNDMIAKNALESEVKTVNAMAKQIINNSLNPMITIGNVIKSILEEFKAGKVTIVANWKDLQGTMEHPLEEVLLSTYKKLFYLIQLIQQAMKD